MRARCISSFDEIIIRSTGLSAIRGKLLPFPRARRQPRAMINERAQTRLILSTSLVRAVAYRFFLSPGEKINTPRRRVDRAGDNYRGWETAAE